MTYRWTPELWNEAQRLRATGLAYREVADRLGLPYRMVTSKFYQASLPAHMRERRNARERAQRAESGSYSVRVPTPTIRPEPPADILAARDARLATPPRDLTAILCGDPLPGYSALERRV